jgi:ABC-2 type transport system permease protein
MRNALAIMQRELLSLFFSPIGYIVIAGFLVVTGIWAVVLAQSFEPGKPASLRWVFQFAPYVLAVFVPAICMRTLSEEYRTGSIETLMTAPVTDTQLVLGKFLAALSFCIVMLAGTAVYLLIMMIFGNPDPWMSLSSYIGLLLLGAAFSAVGVFASSLTRNQVVAWILAAVPLLLLVAFTAWIVPQTEGWLRHVLQYVNLSRHMDDFNKGLLTSEAVVLLLCSVALFLFVSIKVVESRRWR